MYRIEWAKKALRQLMKIDHESRITITASVKNLTDWSACPNVKRLKRHQYQYRLRTGRFRIFFAIENTVKIITIEEVKKT